jgi:hypothetical protein
MSFFSSRLSRMGLFLLLFFCLGAARAALPVTPLEPVYHALFRGEAPAAWQQLINLWPRLNSDAQRHAWQVALTALISRQCGNDLPVAVPAWLDSPTLDLIQRDIPLNRIYRIQLSGKTNRRDLRVTLDLPSGEKLLAEVAPSYQDDGEFMVESKELGEPLPPGVYQLTFTSGGETWRQSLALQGSAALNWIRREGQEIKIQLPAHPAVCPVPWVEQSLLRRPDFVMLWWQRVARPEHLRWPQRADAESLWTNVSVIRAEARGGLMVRVEHWLGGQLVQKGN